MGRFDAVQEIPKSLDIKLGVIISHIGKESLDRLNLTRQALRDQMHQTLKTGRVYVLKPVRKSPGNQAPKENTASELEAELDRVVPA
jgi:hypothetical protein